MSNEPGWFKKNRSIMQWPSLEDYTSPLDWNAEKLVLGYADIVSLWNLERAKAEEKLQISKTYIKVTIQCSTHAALDIHLKRRSTQHTLLRLLTGEVVSHVEKIRFLLDTPFLFHMGQKSWDMMIVAMNQIKYMDLQMNLIQMLIQAQPLNMIDLVS